MAQDIGIQFEHNDPRDKSEHTGLNANALIQFAYQHKEKYPWLSSIDEYGGTLFAPMQVQHLLDELSNMVNDDQFVDSDKNVHRVIESLEAFRSRGEYSYVHFIGD